LNPIFQLLYSFRDGSHAVYRLRILRFRFNTSVSIFHTTTSHSPLFSIFCFHPVFRYSWKHIYIFHTTRLQFQ
jgi:hypothetical protein